MKNDINKVSIVVPVYNVEKYIEKCINSIIMQSYKNLEIIIINDGSTDDSEKKILQIIKRDSRIKYIKKENGGLSSARNRGIKEASGDYICFIDSDDWIATDFVEKLLQSIKKTQTDMVIYNIKYVYENGETNHNEPHIEENVIIDTKSAISELLLGKKYQCHAVNKFCKLSLFKDNSIFFPENKIYEDVFTTYKLILKAKKIYLYNEYLYFYLKNREGSILNTTFNRNRLDMLEAIDLIKQNDDIKKMSLKNELQYFYINSIISLYAYIYPIYNKHTKGELKKYFKIIARRKNDNIYAGYLKNKKLSLSSKIKITMINYCPKTYCNIMKIIKKKK